MAPIFGKKKPNPDPELSNLTPFDAEYAIYLMTGRGHFTEEGRQKAEEALEKLRKEFQVSPAGSKDKKG